MSHKLILVLTSLSCIGVTTGSHRRESENILCQFHGISPTERAKSAQPSNARHKHSALEVFAMLLLEPHPRANFHPSSSTGRFSDIRRDMKQMRRCCERSFCMQEELSATKAKFKYVTKKQAAVTETPADEDQADQEAGREWQKVGVTSKSLIESMRENLGITAPNELQQRSVPVILEGEDVILSSFTGSGKTLAGLVPLISRMLNERSSKHASPKQRYEGELDSAVPCTPQLLVMTPTRELSVQTLRVLEGLLASSPEITAITEQEYLEHNSQRSLDFLYKERLPDIVVGTPRELLLLADQQALAYDQVKYLMLDEVDMLVDTDNYRVGRMLGLLPYETPYQKVLASASALAHPEMNGLISVLLTDGHQIFYSSEDLTTSENEEGALELPPTLNHAVLEIRDGEGEWTSTKSHPEAAMPRKLELLKKIVETRAPQESILVFVNKKKGAGRDLVDKLKGKGVQSELLTSLRKVRNRNLETQRRMESNGAVVVATDEVAARGLDYDSVSLVVNFDLPYGWKNYLHRAGRAGRAGRKGTVISMVSNSKELRFLREKLLSKLGVEALDRVDIEEGTFNGEAADMEQVSKVEMEDGTPQGDAADVEEHVRSATVLKYIPWSEH